MDEDDDERLTADEYYDCIDRFIELEDRIKEHGSLSDEQKLEKDYLETIIEEYEEENKNE